MSEVIDSGSTVEVTGKDAVAFNHSSPTDVSTISGGQDGKTITLFFYTNKTTIKNGTGNIITNSGADKTPAANKHMILWYFGGSWREYNPA